jgi:hypothetical protein
MRTVFVLQHSYPRDDGIDETKFIGVFSSRKDAQLSVRRLRRQPGFRETPRDFHIDAYRLNEGSWSEGFVCMFRGKQVPVRRAKTRRRKA